MTIYSNNEMVEVSHIVEINKQLKKLGSKVKDDLLDGEKHSLSNVLSLACGGGTYGITVDKINSIQSSQFQINCSCENSITGPKIK